jgi:hypothetical protein
MAIAGCAGTTKPQYPETFSDTSTYSRSYPASDAATCEAARRALLSQGYTIGKAQTDGVDGQKNFQVEDDKHQVISFHVVCTSDHQSSPNTTVFVNAVQDRYVIKKTSNSAGVGLSVLGSVSMPFGSSEDSLSKISSQTISTSSFYDGFFDLLQRYLPAGKTTGAGESKTSAKPASQPAPAPAAPASSSPPAAGASSPGGTSPAPSTPPSSAPATSAPATPAPAPSPGPTGSGSSGASSPSAAPPASGTAPASNESGASPAGANAPTSAPASDSSKPADPASSGAATTP